MAAESCRQCGASFPRRDRLCSRCGATRTTDAGPEARRAVVDSASLAPPDQRIGAYLVTTLSFTVAGLIPVVGGLASLGLLIWTALLYQRGRDIGCRAVGLRVVRDTGEPAGFYHMWTRSVASIISLLPLGAGYWTAFSDPSLQTWHDKIMRTYVVRDRPELADLPGTSSSSAVTWFWISVVFIVGAYAVALYALFNARLLS